MRQMNSRTGIGPECNKSRYAAVCTELAKQIEFESCVSPVHMGARLRPTEPLGKKLQQIAFYFACAYN